MRDQQTILLSARAPGAARHSLDRFTDLIEPSLLDDLRLLTSEVVTNAVQHSGRPQGDPITIDTTVESHLVRVEVVDQGEGIQPLRPRSATPPSGLGYLQLLSDRWSGATVNSFQVWFEIDVKTNGIIKRRTQVNPSGAALPEREEPR